MTSGQHRTSVVWSSAPSAKFCYTKAIRDGPISRWAKTGEPREKPPGTPARRTWLVSHVASAGLEPTPDTAWVELTGAIFFPRTLSGFGGISNFIL